MVTGCKLSIKYESPSVEQTKYRSMIGGLQYLIHTILYIVNVVGIVVRFQDDPKETHLKIVKRFFRYLEGKLDYNSWYARSHNSTLWMYTDANQEGSVEYDRKSTSGGSFFLRRRLVSWINKKLDCISQSTIEAKYVEATNNSNQIIWMKKMLKDIEIEFTEPIIMQYDIASTMSMSKNLVLHSNN